MNKKAYSPGFSIFIAGIIICVGALAWIIFNFTLSQYVIPAIETTVNDSIGEYGFNETHAQEVAAQNTRMNLFWSSSLAIMFIIIIVFTIINSISRE